MGIDANRKLVQRGWEAEPSFKFLSWEAQWLQHLSSLRANLSRPALTVPVFKSQVADGLEEM